jgi:HAD superfamily phosphatase (TIGR01668 family)
MDKFIPDIYQKSIYDINYKKLKKRGIKCILFDLDNTLITYEDREINNKIKNLFAKLEDDFKVIIMSNSGKKRLTPIKEALNVDVAFSSRKPFKYKYKKILSLYGFKDYEVAAIGDQLITDIFGANNMGFTSILVNRLNTVEPITTRINRHFERKILKSLSKKGILEKGKYYE